MRLTSFAAIVTLVLLPNLAYADGSFRKAAVHRAQVMVEECDPFSKARLPDCDAGQGAELSMVQLQSLVSQRQQVVQMTTGMMNALQCDACIANIGR